MEKKRVDILSLPQDVKFPHLPRWMAEVKGLDASAEDWPDNIPLLYYSYHIMWGSAQSSCHNGAFRLEVVERDPVHLTRMLWALMLALPSLNRQHGRLDHRRGGTQPWLIYG